MDYDLLDIEDDIVFDLVDESTVKRLVRDKKVVVPKKKVAIPKDKRWNEKLMGSKLLQAIQNGDSIPTLAKSLTEVIGNNMASAIRNARTMTTSAENHGRLDSYKNLDAQGVVQKKVWMSTPDDRTRPTHIDIDGEEQNINDLFSNGCQYPGDGKGPAEEVWCCRCSMKDYIVGFRRKDGSISYVEGDRGETMHDRQMVEEKERRRENSKKESNVVQGKDISETWERRSDKFDFEIEDIINAQGFDGLPKVVDAEEFDRYVQEANDGKGFIAQRTYSAPDQETLDAYREQLYNGKWYVDCSVGESHYGQGMYCTANEGQTINDSIKNTMDKYIKINLDRITDYGDLRIDVKSGIETFTITPDAKLINYEDLRKLKEKEITELSSNGNYDKMNEIFNMDNGSFAVMKGYDGIIGVYNFVSKNNDDAIILNRTKVIFKKGE